VRGSKTTDEWFDEWDVRKESYWSVFAGGCGVTYGCHPIWQFWDGKAKKLTDPRRSWKDDLNLPGARQVGYLRRLVEARTPLTRLPDQALITSPNPDGAEHLEAIRDRGGNWAMIYSASGRPFTLDLARLVGSRLRVWWFDPRTGKPRSAEEVPGRESRPFSPPTSGDGQDWVLVLDRADQTFPALGE
jgi:hypothetical protein